MNTPKKGKDLVRSKKIKDRDNGKGDEEQEWEGIDDHMYGDSQPKKKRKGKRIEKANTTNKVLMLGDSTGNAFSLLPDQDEDGKI